MASDRLGRSISLARECRTDLSSLVPNCGGLRDRELLASPPRRDEAQTSCHDTELGGRVAIALSLAAVRPPLCVVVDGVRRFRAEHGEAIAVVLGNSVGAISRVDGNDAAAVTRPAKTPGPLRAPPVSPRGP